MATGAITWLRFTTRLSALSCVWMTTTPTRLPSRSTLGSRDRQLPTGLVPVRENSGFKGYSWYDNLACCRNFKLTIDGKPAEDAAHPLAVTIVNGIQLSFDLERAGAIEQVAWNLPFAGWGEKTKTKASLSSRATASGANQFALPTVLPYRCRSTSRLRSERRLRSGQLRTQEQYFKQRYEEAIIEAIGGALAAGALALSRALGWDLTKGLSTPPTCPRSGSSGQKTGSGRWTFPPHPNLKLMD